MTKGDGERGTDSWDHTHVSGAVDSHWTTDNLGEACPGVQSPLNASIWVGVGDRCNREMARQLGVFSRREARQPRDPREYFTQVFFGRLAIQMEFLATIGDRTPGTSGREVVQALFGRVPDGMVFRPSRRRYPLMAVRYPYLFLVTPTRLRRMAAETDAWWRSSRASLPALGEEPARRLLLQAVDRFEITLTAQSLGLHACVQPTAAALERLVQRAGVGDVADFSGVGGAEMAIVSDIWAASRGRITVDEVIDRHGFHGPMEGEVSSVVWREDPEPLRRMIQEYARRSDDDRPDAGGADRHARVLALRRELLAALPTRSRPAARLLLRLAGARLPLRGVGKRAYVQSLDVARGAARALGARLAERGVLADPEDVFYLTVDELRAGAPADSRELVERRRARREEYRSLDVPARWKGVPEPTSAATELSGDVVEGIGVSPGVVEGRVRVVDDPSFADVEPGEVLVATTTDPSWASVMFIASALVTDIGGALSHTAVVAREMGVPCVVNTGNGSRALRTGDLVRVDGASGTVTVLDAAALA